MNLKQFDLVIGTPYDLQTALDKMWEKGYNVDEIQIVRDATNGEYHFFIFYSRYKAK